MKKLLILLMVSVSVIVMTGCKSIDNLTQGISEKSISGSGMVTVNRVGLDKTNQTPELFNIFTWGDYNSIVPGDEMLRYEASEDASIFNSNAKSSKIKIFFASGDKDRMDKFLDAVKADADSRLKKAEAEAAAK